MIVTYNIYNIINVLHGIIKFTQQISNKMILKFLKFHQTIIKILKLYIIFWKYFKNSLLF